MSVVEALDTAPQDTYVEFHNTINEMANPQNSGAVLELKNTKPSANEPSYDTKAIQTNSCLTSDVQAVSLMPGIDPKNNPIGTVELNEVNPVPKDGMTPMLGLQVIDEVCEHTKGMIVDNKKAANEEVYNTVQPGLQEQQLAVQTRFYEQAQAQALEQSGPSPS